MVKQKESRTISCSIRISEETDELLDKICKDYGGKKGKMLSLCAIFGIIKIIEVLDEAHFDTMTILDSNEADPKKIKRYVKNQISKYKINGRTDIKSMREILKRYGDDELFKSLLNEVFNGEHTKEEDMEELADEQY